MALLISVPAIAIAQTGPGQIPSPWAYGPSLSIFYNNGGVTLGSPVGGNLGIGTINVHGGYYIDGTLIAGAVGSQPANLVYASPNGSSGTPTFRSIANGDLPANRTVSGTLGVTGLASFGAVTASGAISGAGFAAYLASPPCVGCTVPGSGAFGTLSATGTISGVGFSNYLASPPPIGGTAPNTGSFAAPLNVGSPSIVGGTINALDTGTTFSNQGYNFIIAPASMASFGANQHYGAAVQMTKPVSGSTTTGSWTAEEVNMFGAGGSASSDFFTGLITRAIPNVGDGVHNLFGSFTGLNTVAAVPASMTTNSVVSEEADVQSFSATGFRQGLRIADLSGSTGVQATGDDDAISIYSNGGPGWKTGITFGDATTGSAWPVSSRLITTAASSTASMAVGIDLTNLTSASAFTSAAIALPQLSNTIAWGTGPIGSGGFISSNAASSGGNMLFKASETDFQFGGNTAIAIMPSRIQFNKVTIANALAVTCNAAAEGEVLYIKDTVGSAAVTFHLIVAGAGATAVDSPAYCDGTNWRYF